MEWSSGPRNCRPRALFFPCTLCLTWLGYLWCLLPWGLLRASPVKGAPETSKTMISAHSGTLFWTFRVQPVLLFIHFRCRTITSCCDHFTIPFLFLWQWNFRFFTGYWIPNSHHKMSKFQIEDFIQDIRRKRSNKTVMRDTDEIRS